LCCLQLESLLLYYLLQKELENLEYAEEELMMLDGDEPIPYPFAMNV